MTAIVLLYQGGQPVAVDDIWIPITAALTVLLAVMGGTWTLGKAMSAQNDKIRGLAEEIVRLRSDIEHRFERLDDRHHNTVSQREWYKWIDRFRRGNPNLDVPAPYQEEG
jgi:hypothetical protein